MSRSIFPALDVDPKIGRELVGAIWVRAVLDARMIRDYGFYEGTYYQQIMQSAKAMFWAIRVGVESEPGVTPDHVYNWARKRIGEAVELRGFLGGRGLPQLLELVDGVIGWDFDSRDFWKHVDRVRPCGRMSSERKMAQVYRWRGRVRRWRTLYEEAGCPDVAEMVSEKAGQWKMSVNKTRLRTG